MDFRRGSTHIKELMLGCVITIIIILLLCILISYRAAFNDEDHNIKSSFLPRLNDSVEEQLIKTIELQDSC